MLKKSKHFLARRFMREVHSSFVDSSVDFCSSFFVVNVSRCCICNCILTSDNRSVDLVNCCGECAHSLES